MEINFDKSLLGLNIKYLRKQKKLTQGVLSEIIGVKSTTLSNWEVGLSSPDLDYIVKISNYFGVSLDEIVLIPVGEWEGSNKVIRSECALCRQKDITISAKDALIELLREKISAQEKRPASNSNYQQTA